MLWEALHNRCAIYDVIWRSIIIIIIIIMNGRPTRDLVSALSVAGCVRLYMLHFVMYVRFFIYLFFFMFMWLQLVD